MKIVSTDLHDIRREETGLRIAIRATVRGYAPELPLEILLRLRKGATSKHCRIVRLAASEACDDTAEVDIAFEGPWRDLHDAIWDAWIRTDDGEIRIRTNRLESEYETMCVLSEGAHRVRPYDTSDAQLSFRVAPIDHDVVALDRVHWDGGVFVIEGTATTEHGLEVMTARAVWPTEALEHELRLTRGENGRLIVRHDTATVECDAPCHFEWRVREPAGQGTWCRVGISKERQRPFRHWILPIAGGVGARGDLWVSARIDRANDLVLEPTSPIDFSLTKVRARALPAPHALIRLEMDALPARMPRDAAASLEEIEGLRLVWMHDEDRARRTVAAELKAINRTELRVSAPPRQKHGDVDASLRVEYRLRGREYLVPAPVTSPAARRKYGKFEDAALPTRSFDGRAHAFVVDGEQGFTLRYIRRKRSSAEKARTRAKDTLAAAAARVVGALASREVWLVGENMGTVAQDNGVTFFEHCLESGKPEQVFFVARPNNRHLDRLKKNASHVVKHNSFAHYYYYHRSNRLVVAHGIRDVLPSLHHRQVSKNEKSVVYLQHGIIAMKRVYYSNDTYNGRIDAFVVSSEFEKDLMVRYNRFSPSRIVVSGLPRYDTLTPLPPDGTILVMPTWREWSMGSAAQFEGSAFLAHYRALLTNPALLAALRAAGARVRFYPHIEIEKRFRDRLDFECDVVEVCSYSGTDMQHELRKCSALVTDYSSVAWDVNYMGKPVFFFHFDRDEYERRRGSYVDLERELPGHIFENEAAVSEALVQFLRGTLPSHDEAPELSARYYAFHDRNNSERVYRAVRRLRSSP